MLVHLGTRALSEAGGLKLRDLGTRSTWATGRTTWLALAMPIDLGDWPNDSVHPGCLDRPGRLAEQPGNWLDLAAQRMPHRHD